MRGFIAIAIAGMVSGCASNQPDNGAPWPNLQGKVATDRAEFGKINDLTLQKDFGHERTALVHGQQAPMIGLALSGGGTKAAMFAHGVMHGLHASGILEKVDVISTVSGGGYAALWYYTKLIEAEKTPGFEVSNIFNDCLPTYWTAAGKNEDKLDVAMAQALAAAEAWTPGSRSGIVGKCRKNDHWTQGDPFRWQAHIARWPDVFSDTPVIPTGEVQGKPSKEMTKGVLKAFFLEPFKQMFNRGSAIPELYQAGIERAWGANPQPRNEPGGEKWSHTNTLASRHEDEVRIDPKLMNWQELRKLHEDYARRPRDRNLPLWIVNANSGGKSKSDTDNASRNFEMTAYGSGNDELGYVNDYVPIVDLATSVRASAGFGDLQGLKLTWARKPAEFLTSIWRGGRWGVDVQVPDQHGELQKRRLSDGGGADNLGLISLLKRGIPHIIVVDTGADDEGNMSDLCDAMKAISDKDIDITIAFDTLPHLGTVCKGEAAYNVSDWKSPVVEGTAKWNKTGRTSKIWLIKAAWYQPGVARTYNSGKCGEPGMTDCLLTVFYGHNTGTRVNGKDDMSGMVFPQLGTAGATMNFSSYLFWGYRELGRSVGRELRPDGKGGIMSTSKRCYQPTGEFVKGQRPYLLSAAVAGEPCPQTAKFVNSDGKERFQGQ